MREVLGISGVPDYTCTEYAPRQSDYCLLIPIINEGGRILAELDRGKKAGVPGLVDIAICDGGSTDGNGADLVIGSGSYIDEFEEQLIGSHPGDQIRVEVTFPDNYSSEELSGKDAVFDVTVNGIYQ